MNHFNKLYNNILNNIINQNKETRKALIQKSDIQNKNNICMYLNTIAIASSNKVADFLCKFFASGEIKDIQDKRIQQVIDILDRKTDIDIQQDISLEQFLNKYQEYLNTSLDLDNISQLSDKKEYKDGIVTYKVQDDKQGMKAVRKIVDMQWGKKANPWCLISRTGGNLDAWHYWQRYNAYSKHIAFQDGKLLAFCANTNKHILWWDRHNQLSHKLKDLYGNEVQTELIEPYPFEQRFRLKFNKRTGRWDSELNITITNGDLIDGHFPVQFGYIKGKFFCQNLDDLVSLQGAPQYIEGNFKCRMCDNLTSLIGGPKVVMGDYSCHDCKQLKSLEGAPEHVWGTFDCDGCKSLTSFIGGPTRVEKQFDASGCSSVKTCQGAPRSCSYFVLDKMYSLESLEGSPQNVDYFWISSCDNLRSLKGCPEKINKSFELNWCPGIKNLIGGPKIVGGEVLINHCHNLQSVEGKPEKIGGQVKLFDCDKVKI